MRTPYSQWFTKNLTSVYGPLAQLLEVAPGHAPGLQKGPRMLGLCLSISVFLRLLAEQATRAVWPG